MSGIFAAYVAGAARDLYGAHFADAGDRRRSVERARRPLAAEIATVVERQNARFAASPARDANVAALRAGAAAVVTGQQVGLFLGPLFNLYKAASAIRAARALAAESGHPVVPVFWLQTEDHDLPEIAECRVQCENGAPLELWLPASAADRESVAHHRLPGEVAACLERLGAEIGPLPRAAAHLERLARHYRPGAGWVDAFAGVLAELFADDGLVLVDPRDPEIAAATAHVHRRALAGAGALAEGLLRRGRELDAAGFAPAVHVRPGAPLSFFHPAGAAGPRYRLEPCDAGFAEVGGERSHAPETLLAALEREPLCFSTSVLLRPILQDTLLPVAAYVGGPAEVAYFAQLAPLYAAYDLPMPLVVPRARLALIEGKTARLLARLGIDAEGAARPEDEILAAAGADRGEEADDVAGALLDPFDAALAAARPRIEAAGAGLDTAIDKTRAAVEVAVRRLAARWERARLHADRERVEDVRRLKALLYPNDVPQERFYGCSYFAARYGERELIERVLAAIDPFDAAPRAVFLEESR